MDVRDEEAVQRTVAGVIARFGRLDVLVNNAGLARVGPVTNLSLEDWNAIVELNLTGPFLCAKY